MLNEIIDIVLSLLTLTVLEIVLGVDNLVFLAIITQRLPKSQQRRARQVGLTLAWVTRLLLLASALFITHLIHPLFSVFGMGISWRDIFLFLGGLFLIAKSTQEIHIDIEPEVEKPINTVQKSRFNLVVIQIALLDIIFSIDSVLTAIGLTQRFWIMAVAITIAIGVMIFVSEPLSAFIERHPTIKMLALSFLILIGVFLIADSLEYHIPRGYLYFAISFSLFIEFLNILRRKRRRLIE